MIKTICSIVLFPTLCITVAAAQNRAELLTELQNKYESSIAAFQNGGESQLEMDSDSGKLRSVAKSLLLEAADFRLAAAKNSDERMMIMRSVIAVTRKADKIVFAPPEDAGSAEPMLRNVETAALIMREIQILLQSDESAARWQRIAGATGIVGINEVQFENGTAIFSNRDNIELQAEFSPQHTFSGNGRDFAIITVDRPCSMSPDYLKLYLCEFKDGNIVSCGALVKITEKCLSATNGTEMVTLEMHPLDEAPLKAVVSLFALRQAVGGGKSGEVEFKIEGDELGVYESVRGQSRRFGLKVNAEPWPVLELVPDVSNPIMLSDKFTQAIAQAAQVIPSADSFDYVIRMSFFVFNDLDDA